MVTIPKGTFALFVIATCIYPNFGKIDTCEEFLKHVKNERFKGHLIEETYVSKISCLICSKPECDFAGGKCSKISSTPPIPLYNNMLEFGLVGNFLPLLAFAKVKINNKCYIKTEITNKVDQGKVLIRIFTCSKRSCDPPSYEIEFTLTNEDRCVQVGLMFLEKNKIFYAFSPTCQKVSTAFFESSKFLEIKRNRCEFDEEKNEMEVHFSFLQDDTRKIDGVPLTLPCNGGGYAVDPNRGSFWNKIECWDYLTISDFPSNNKGLDFVILKKFGGHEDYRFPVANDDWTLDEVYPPYFDKNEMFIEYTESIIPPEGVSHCHENWCRVRENRTRRLKTWRDMVVLLSEVF
ncbi:UNVERIFIED_CONTAM: hypothetical protein RMT77_013875 [Armadillidium vulgare]